MSNTPSNEIKAPIAQHPHLSAPDGKSELPKVLPDFPGDPKNDSGPTNGPVPK